jgi:hypothetical protein
MESIQDDPRHVTNYRGIQTTPQDKKLFSEAINNPIFEVMQDLVVVGLQIANLVLEFLKQPQLFGAFSL